jgi:hypothetical protein
MPKDPLIDLVEQKLEEKNKVEQEKKELDKVNPSEARKRSLANLKPRKKGDAVLKGAGRPAILSIAKLGAKHQSKIFSNLIEIAYNPENSTKDRIEASKYLWDRWLGKPAQNVQLEGKVDHEHRGIIFLPAPDKNEQKDIIELNNDGSIKVLDGYGKEE